MRTELVNFKETLQGQDVFILGGGASIRNFDFTRLKDKFTIVLNSTIERVDACTGVFWTDYDWGAQNEDKLKNYDCFKFSVRKHCDNYINKGIRGIANSTVLRKGNDYGFSMDINEVCGNNSGAQAINLVANCQPYRIILLGFDMGFVNGHSHCHDEYVMSMPSIYEELFIPSINSMANIIEKLGIPVINCSMKSNLKCFIKDEIDNIL